MKSSSVASVARLKALKRVIMELIQQFVTTKDGRQLEFGTIGNESGKTVVFHHGTPGCLYTFMEYQELVDLGDFTKATSGAVTTN